MAGFGGVPSGFAKEPGPKPSGPPVPQPKSSKPVVVKAHVRAAPAPKPPKAQGPKAQGPRAPSAPVDPLLGQAQALANIQTQGPLTELQKQIAANNAQTTGTINQTGGFYNQLEPFVQSSVNQQGQIASGLNSTLAGIGQNTQSQLQGIGQGAMASLAKYAPGDNATAASGDLAAQIARQQGLAAQQAGTYQGFGANQGANYQGLGASQLGTFGLQGQEALRGIAQSGTVKNEPLVSKIAALQAQKGALTATDLGKLQQQQTSNQIAQAGLGIKAATVAGTQALGKAKVAATLRGQNITAANDRATQANRLAAIAQSNLNNLRSTNTSAANNAANNSTRQLIAQMRGTTAKTGKPATGAQANAVFSHIDYVTGEIQNLISHGIPPAQAYHLIQNGGRIQTGTTSSGAATYRTYFPNRLGTQVLNAAYNVRSGGAGLTPGDLAWFASLGIKNPTRYPHANQKTVGGPIKSAGGSGTVGGAVSGTSGGNLF